MRLEQEAARAKARRQERRKCLKEQRRILELADVLAISVVGQCEQRDFSVTMPVYDVRDYKSAAENGPGIFAFGGLLGEIMIALSAFQETMITRMEQPSFEMRRDHIFKFIEELMFEGWGQGICYLQT